MPVFRYRAMTSAGAIVTGILDAPSETAAIQEVRNLGHYPIQASPGTDETWLSRLRRVAAADLLPRQRLSMRSLGVATRELAALLRAGLELDRALSILVNLDEMRPMRATFSMVLDRVRAGESFAAALDEAPLFPKFFVNVVRAGEHGGDLTGVLEHMADYLERSGAVRETVLSALIYPALLLATAGLSIMIVLVYVLPSFEPLFAEQGKALPLVTRIVMGVGGFVADWSWAILLAAAALTLGMREALKDARFRMRRDALLLRLPLLGALLTKIDVERFSRTLGTLLSNGVALPQSLLLTADTLANSRIAAAVRDAATHLKEGGALAGYLKGTALFPTLTTDLISVGEESGQLSALLSRQADLYEREVKHTVDRLVALLVPGLTIFMGAIVAGLIGSILIAILSVNDLAI